MLFYGEVMIFNNKGVLDARQWQETGSFNVEGNEICMVSSVLWPKDGVQFSGCVPGAHKAWTLKNSENTQNTQPKKDIALLVCQSEYQPWNLTFELLPFLMNLAEHQDIGLWCMHTYDELIGMGLHDAIVEDAQNLVKKSQQTGIGVATGTVNYGAIMIVDNPHSQPDNSEKTEYPDLMIQSFVAFDDKTGEIAAIYVESINADTCEDYPEYDEYTSSVSTALSSYYTTVVCSRKFYQDLMSGV